MSPPSRSRRFRLPEAVPTSLSSLMLRAAHPEGRSCASRAPVTHELRTTKDAHGPRRTENAVRKTAAAQSRTGLCGQPLVQAEREGFEPRGACTPNGFRVRCRYGDLQGFF